MGSAAIPERADSGSHSRCRYEDSQRAPRQRLGAHDGHPHAGALLLGQGARGVRGEYNVANALSLHALGQVLCPTEMRVCFPLPKRMMKLAGLAPNDGPPRQTPVGHRSQ
jgi:hypothetical protein